MGDQPLLDAEFLNLTLQLHGSLLLLALHLLRQTLLVLQLLLQFLDHQLAALLLGTADALPLLGDPLVEPAGVLRFQGLPELFLLPLQALHLGPGAMEFADLLGFLLQFLLDEGHALGLLPLQAFPELLFQGGAFLTHALAYLFSHLPLLFGALALQLRLLAGKAVGLFLELSLLLGEVSLVLLSDLLLQLVGDHVVDVDLAAAVRAGDPCFLGHKAGTWAWKGFGDGRCRPKDTTPGRQGGSMHRCRGWMEAGFLQRKNPDPAWLAGIRVLGSEIGKDQFAPSAFILSTVY